MTTILFTTRAAKSRPARAFRLHAHIGPGRRIRRALGGSVARVPVVKFAPPVAVHAPPRSADDDTPRGDGPATLPLPSVRANA